MATILVVDDHPQVCRMLAFALENDGFAVLIAFDGSEALRIANSRFGRFDLLLSDLDMPGMDGASLAQALRVKYLDLPIILMSAAWSPSVLRVSNPAAFLLKPFSVSTLATMAHAMIGARNGDARSRRSALAATSPSPAAAGAPGRGV